MSPHPVAGKELVGLGISGRIGELGIDSGVLDIGRKKEDPQGKGGETCRPCTPPGWGRPSGELWIVQAYAALGQSGKGAGRSALFFTCCCGDRVSCTPIANASAKTPRTTPC